MQKIEGVAKNSLVWGWVIFFFSFCFGFYEFVSVLSASQAGLGDVAYIIAYFGLTLLWGILGATLIIFGGIMSVVLSNLRKVAEITPTVAKENSGK
jgi:hypothetical protein